MIISLAKDAFEPGFSWFNQLTAAVALEVFIAEKIIEEIFLLKFMIIKCDVHSIDTAVFFLHFIQELINITQHVFWWLLTVFLTFRLSILLILLLLFLSLLSLDSRLRWICHIIHNVISSELAMVTSCVKSREKIIKPVLLKGSVANILHHFRVKIWQNLLIIISTKARLQTRNHQFTKDFQTVGNSSYLGINASISNRFMTCYTLRKLKIGCHSCYCIEYGIILERVAGYTKPLVHSLDQTICLFMEFFPFELFQQQD